MATDSQVKDEKHNIGALMKELSEAVKCEPNSDDQKAADIIRILDNVNGSAFTPEDVLEIPDKIVDDVFLTLLDHKSESIKAKTAMTIAELGKIEEGRTKCTNDKLVNALLGLLMLEDVNVLTQTSRALGNICCDNDDSKKLIRESTGINYIIEVLKKGISLGHAEGAGVLRNASVGFLLNFLVGETLGDSELQDLVELIVPYICSILEVDGPVGGESAKYVLLSLGILNDSNIPFLNERLTKALANILGNDSLTELPEMCLEVLQGQADFENAKVLMAKEGICNILIKFIEKRSSECTEEVVVMICNILVLVVTGDESMSLLYGNGEGFVYKKLIEWLESSNEELQINAILAMGNFARSDKNCETMVQQNIHCKLLTLISKIAQTPNIRVQYALLSTLRNLVIPAKNKPVLLEAGLIDILTPMLDTSPRGFSFLMLFKLLGTFRIVIDGQSEAAITLGTKTDVIEKAVEWSNNEDNPGLQGESCRLISWLITNSKNQKIIESVIKHNGIKPLVKMLVVQHAIMQNEGVLSLIILLLLSNEKCEQQLIDANIGENLSKLLDEKAQNIDQSKLVPETINLIRNSITLNEALLKSDSLKEHLVKSDVAKSWRKILKSSESELEQFRDSIESICSKMENNCNN